MDDLERARQLWIAERPDYERFVEFLVRQLREKIHSPKIQIYGRPKEIDSLLKKLIRKSDKTYESLTDKAGVRVVVNFTNEVDTYGRIIEELFPKHKKDDKRTELIRDERIGYQGIHYDISLSDAEASDTGFKDMWAEIQVRTLAQHLWSDMSHELGYKSELQISEVTSRRLLRLNALVELADDVFLDVRNELMEMPEFNVLKILGVLEGEFFKFAAVDYDKELSVQTIDQLNALYGEGGFLSDSEEFKEFCKDKSDVISHIFDDNRNVPNRPIFLFQPESLMIFQLLERDKFTLREKWGEIYPIKELEQLAIKWGKPYV